MWQSPRIPSATKETGKSRFIINQFLKVFGSDLDVLGSTAIIEIRRNFRDKVRTGSMSSGEFSEYDEGGGEFGAGVKINEWQAAWNVTNAIQVSLDYKTKKTKKLQKF